MIDLSTSEVNSYYSRLRSYFRCRVWNGPDSRQRAGVRHKSNQSITSCSTCLQMKPINYGVILEKHFFSRHFRLCSTQTLRGSIWLSNPKCNKVIDRSCMPFATWCQPKLINNECEGLVTGCFYPPIECHPLWTGAIRVRAHLIVHLCFKLPYRFPAVLIGYRSDCCHINFYLCIWFRSKYKRFLTPLCLSARPLSFLVCNTLTHVHTGRGACVCAGLKRVTLSELMSHLEFALLRIFFLFYGRVHSVLIDFRFRSRAGWSKGHMKIMTNSGMALPTHASLIEDFSSRSSWFLFSWRDLLFQSWWESWQLCIAVTFR